MSVAAFLDDLRRRDVRVWAEGDRLHCDAPSGVLTPELRDELRLRKGDLLEFLRAAQSLAGQERALVPLHNRGAGIPVFAVPGHNGDVFCYRALARYLGDERPFFGLEPPGLDGFSEPMEDIGSLADYFAAQIRAFRADAPCILGGYCAGGTVALELARRLQERGTPVRYVALFACPYPTWYRWPAQLRWRLRKEATRMAGHLRAMMNRPPSGWSGYLEERLRDRRARLAAEAVPAGDPALVRRAAVERATLRAVRAYRPSPIAGRIGIFLPFQDAVLNDGAWRWRALAESADEYLGAPGTDGFNLLRDPHAFATAELLRRALDAADRAP